MKTCIWILALVAVALGKEDLFEGDIVLDKETQDIMEGKAGSAFDAMTSRKWTNGIIPYVFDGRFDSGRRRVVQQAIEDYSKYTCIKFVPRSNQRNYVRFMIGGGCYSSIGMTGRGSQDISIGNGCNYKGTVIHEMMHAAGFFHEQSRRDRDNYVTIYWNNIQRGMEYNFKKYNHGEADTLGEPYDLDSVMHYDKYSFSTNRQPTIVAKNDPNRRLGQRNGFSQIDIKQLNKMYSCSGGGGGGGTKPSGCVDKSGDCGTWAGKGFCTSGNYVDYMRENCCKSCKGAGGGGSCTDGHQNCAYWASRGECRKNPRWMLANCKKSCKKC